MSLASSEIGLSGCQPLPLRQIILPSSEIGSSLMSESLFLGAVDGALGDVAAVLQQQGLRLPFRQVDAGDRPIRMEGKAIHIEPQRLDQVADQGEVDVTLLPSAVDDVVRLGKLIDQCANLRVPLFVGHQQSSSNLSRLYGCSVGFRSCFMLAMIASRSLTCLRWKPSTLSSALAADSTSGHDRRAIAACRERTRSLVISAIMLPPGQG